jgi:hypothetical protein
MVHWRFLGLDAGMTIEVTIRQRGARGMLVAG